MGWASGSDLMAEVIAILVDTVPQYEKRKVIYKRLINAFEYHDWDCQQDCLELDEAFDEVLNQMYPDGNTEQ